MLYIHFVLFLSDEWPTLETLDFTIRIRSTPTFLYFDLYLLTLLVQSVSEISYLRFPARTLACCTHSFHTTTDISLTSTDLTLGQ